MPALTVVALFRFLWAWNDYLGPLIYINQDSMYPLALGIARLRQNVSATGSSALAYPYLMAVSTIVVAPILALFFLAQTHLYRGHLGDRHQGMRFRRKGAKAQSNVGARQRHCRRRVRDRDDG